MPTGLETVIRGLLQQQAAGGRASLAQQAMQMKTAQQQQLEDYRQQLNDFRAEGLKNANQRVTMVQQAADQKNAINKGFTDYLMNADVNKFPDDARPGLINARNYIAEARKRGVSDIDTSGIAHLALIGAKPHAFRVMGTPIMNPDGSSSTEFTVVDTDTSSLGGVGSAPGVADPGAGLGEDPGGADADDDDGLSADYPEFGGGP